MAVDPQQYALLQSQQPSQNWAGLCQTFVRSALGFSPGVPGGESAKSEYQYTKSIGGIHTDNSPPPNVPVYFVGGSDGHVALSAGGGYVWSTDANPDGTYAAGQVSLVKISDLSKHFGGYLGWGQSEGPTLLDLSGKTYNVGGSSVSAAAGSVLSGALGDVGNGIVSGLKTVFTSDFMKRLGAALAGGLLILMALWKLSGATAVPIPV